MLERFTGSPDVVAEHLEHYRQVGLEDALCLFECEDLNDLLRQMRLFAEQVIPRFADAGWAHHRQARWRTSSRVHFSGRISLRKPATDSARSLRGLATFSWLTT